MVLNTGIQALTSLSLIILTCFLTKNKRFENKSESFYHVKSDTIFYDFASIEMEKWMLEERKHLDSTCKAETKRAETDIKKNKLVYFHYFGMIDSYRSNVEINNLLKKHNIKVDSALHYCTVPIELQNCYARVMRKEIDRKFGNRFIDSLRHIAELQYVNKNLNKIYSFEECDTISRYPEDKTYSDFFKSYEKNFWSSVKYPDDYEYRKDKDYYSYLSADFILHKNGNVSDIKIRLTFQNKKNYKYASYFINELKKFIKNTKWVPAKTMGIIVNSEVPLTLHFK
ncbi:hypothetical protein [Chryseobacterium oryctis]|uniref:TonB C-terminal domain-containing protein n=1 Tax=Chryseobacterium oryctis TaxID=2952618 RepID=A0ABT3HSG3_9FLAO|nr:hypothetical protein [Chryseobacterium oryctis]MCW3162714.1 hypothetical protein [Chryseobacterium oryctis]